MERAATFILVLAMSPVTSAMAQGDLVDQAESLAAAGDDAAALALLRIAVARDPSPRAQGLLGLAALRTGDVGTAQGSLHAALQVPQDPWVAAHQSELVAALVAATRRGAAETVTEPASPATPPGVAPVASIPESMTRRLAGPTEAPSLVSPEWSGGVRVRARLSLAVIYSAAGESTELPRPEAVGPGVALAGLGELGLGARLGLELGIAVELARAGRAGRDPFHEEAGWLVGPGARLGLVWRLAGPPGRGAMMWGLRLGLVIDSTIIEEGEPRSRTLIGSTVGTELGLRLMLDRDETWGLEAQAAMDWEPSFDSGGVFVGLGLSRAIR